MKSVIRYKLLLWLSQRAKRTTCDSIRQAGPVKLSYPQLSAWFL